jgi:hypothetical protein
MTRTPEQGSRSWRKLGFLAGGVAIVVAAAISFSKGPARTGDSASPIPVAGTPAEVGTFAASGPARVVAEDKGRLELVHRVVVPEVSLARETVPEPPLHANFGGTATVRFAVHDEGGLPRKLAHPSAKAAHGDDPPVDLPVVDAGDGRYEVPFRPNRPGRFDIVLADGGVPVDTRRVGVVGVAGAPGDSTDADFLSVDPRAPRTRTGGKSSLR